MDLITLLRTLKEHRSNQRLPREEFERKRLSRFRGFVRYVQQHSPYYATVMREHRIEPATCVPEQFPILTKQLLMAHFDEIATDRAVTKEAVGRFFARSKDPNELFAGRFVAIHSSGTSGEVSYFVYSKDDWIRGMAHNYRMTRFSLRKRRIAFYGMTGGHYAGVSFVNTPNQSILRRLYEIQEFDVNTPLPALTVRMNAFQPTIIVGYPSSILKLAEKQLNGQLHIRPETFQISGEMLSATDRLLMERAFPDSELINVYSCSDHMIMGIGRPGDEGIYLMEDSLIFEPLEDSLLVTNLFNYTLPLIRYQMNDRVILASEDRVRAYPFMKIKEIVGRAENSPKFINKHGARDTISQHIIGEMLVEGLKAMQVKVMSDQAFVVLFTVDETVDPATRETVQARLEEAWRDVLRIKEMDNVEFRTEQVDRLDIDERTGKFRLLADAPQLT